MPQRDTTLGLLTLAGLVIGMAMLGTGRTADWFLYATAAVFAVGVLSLIGLVFTGLSE